MIIFLSILLGLFLGLIGGGGSVLAVPLLRYGMDLDTETAIPGALLVVGLASLVGVYLHARGGRVRWHEGLFFAALSTPAAYAAGRIAGFIPEPMRMPLFAMALIYFAYRLIRRGRDGRGRNAEDEVDSGGSADLQVRSGSESGSGSTAGADLEVRTPEEPVDKPRLIVAALSVGALTGCLGVGGGIMVTSALVVVLRLSMKHAVGTSLVVVASNAFAGLAGHIGHAELPWGKLALVAALAVPGCVLGTRLGARMPKKWLRLGLGWAVMLIAAAVLWREMSGAW
ncbi:MAG: hypothetical protein CMJ83_12980 [Planctomycetes bacterium]|nr:hypothetical protein [Planctomycetota bacterium]